MYPIRNVPCTPTKLHSPKYFLMNTNSSNTPVTPQGLLEKYNVSGNLIQKPHSKAWASICWDSSFLDLRKGSGGLGFLFAGHCCLTPSHINSKKEKDGVGRVVRRLFNGGKEANPQEEPWLSLSYLASLGSKEYHKEAEHKVDDACVMMKIDKVPFQSIHIFLNVHPELTSQAFHLSSSRPISHTSQWRPLLERADLFSLVETPWRGFALNAVTPTGLFVTTLRMKELWKWWQSRWCSDSRVLAPNLISHTRWNKCGGCGNQLIPYNLKDQEEGTGDANRGITLGSFRQICYNI